MSGTIKNRRMQESNKSESSRPAPYKIPLRKFAKPSSQNNSRTNQPQTTTVPQLTQEPVNQTSQQAIQKTQLGSEVRDYYTNLKNPLSYSGNADEILNKITSYK